MTLEEIRKYHAPHLLCCTGNVFMWTIDKFLFDAEQMMESLGWKLHTRIVWDKLNGICPAFTIRFSHEYLLWFYRPGKILRPDKSVRGKFRSVIVEPHTYHSHKPNAAYEMIEQMFPHTRKLELFARNYRVGWDSIGNEL